MLAWAGAVVGLWVGATRFTGPVARGYRWLGGAALFWFAGLIVSQVLSGQLSSTGLPLSLADVAPLLALASAAIGVMVLAEGERRSDSGSVLPGLADGYVMAVALLVIGWVLAFGAEFHHVGERPETFLAALLHPLSDLAVLGALLPAAKVIPFQRGAPATSKQAGQIPANYSQGSGTIVSGTQANKATEAALAAYPGGIVDRVVKLSNGEYEVHNIGVNWPHHIFVNQGFKVVGAN